MVTLAALYPGQGSQYPQMALDLYDASQAVRTLFTLVSDTTHIDLHALLKTGDEELLKKTEVTQLVVTLANRAAHVRLNELGYTFCCHSGLSLGELSAYAGGGIIDDATLFSLVQQRSLLMAQSSEKVEASQGKLGMAAVIGLGYETVRHILEERAPQSLYASNDNAPKQVVIAGLASIIEQVKPHLVESGARRVLPLKVSGAFHTPFMEDAAKEFTSIVQALPFSEPTERIISSVNGEEVTNSLQAKILLGMQLASPVRWTVVMQRVQELLHEETLLAEVGPSHVLTGLWKQSNFPSSCTPLGRESEIMAIRKE